MSNQKNPVTILEVPSASSRGNENSLIFVISPSENREAVQTIVNSAIAAAGGSYQEHSDDVISAVEKSGIGVFLGNPCNVRDWPEWRNYLTSPALDRNPEGSVWCEAVATSNHWSMLDTGELAPLGLCDDYHAAAKKVQSNSFWVFHQSDLMRIAPLADEFLNRPMAGRSHYAINDGHLLCIGEQSGYKDGEAQYDRILAFEELVAFKQSIDKALALNTPIEPDFSDDDLCLLAWTMKKNHGYQDHWAILSPSNAIEKYEKLQQDEALYCAAISAILKGTDWSPTTQKTIDALREKPAESRLARSGPGL
jgi:hypothetical protein